MQVEKNDEKEDPVIQETLNPLQYFNDYSINSPLLFTAFSNSSETGGFKEKYSEIISNI